MAIHRETPTKIIIDNGVTQVSYLTGNVQMYGDGHGLTRIQADLSDSTMTTRVINGTTTNTSSKGAAHTVANKYDIDTNKNTALDTVAMGIKQLEQALFMQQQQVARETRDQQAKVDASSASLDRILAEALQAGVEIEDLEKHFPQVAGSLETRVDFIVGFMNLDNAEISV